jgi:cyclopropane fatty-acyl-phospholipid synthase-like methyltransferase
MIAVMALLVMLVPVIMLLMQQSLDGTRRISLHCLIRNVLLVVGVYLWSIGVVRAWHVVVAVVLFELLVEVLHQMGISLDPYINKVLNFYRWADVLWSSRRIKAGMDNYTEGRHDCDPHLSIPGTQQSKFEWMAAEGRIGPGSRVLEIGCGNGEFMRYVEAMGGTVVGLTPSADQVRMLRREGLHVELVDIWSIDQHAALHGAFDAVVMNGRTEHFLTVANGANDQSARFKRMFELVDRCLDPMGAGMCVVTAIHLHRDLSPFELLQMYLLERTYGGYYPNTPRTYIDAAALVGFSVLTNQNRTGDYYIWARKIWFNIYAGVATDWRCALRTLVDVPVFMLNDPYYAHKLLHCLLSTWSWQFDTPNSPLLAAADTPPTMHLWLTLHRTPTPRLQGAYGRDPGVIGAAPPAWSTSTMGA